MILRINCMEEYKIFINYLLWYECTYIFYYWISFDENLNEGNPAMWVNEWKHEKN